MAKFQFRTKLPNLIMRMKHAEYEYDSRGRRKVSSPAHIIAFSGVFYSTDDEKEVEFIKNTSAFKNGSISMIKEESPKKSRKSKKKEEQVEPVEMSSVGDSDGS